MPGSSRKHPPDKTEFIAPTEHHTTTCPTKQAGVDCCCRRCSDPNPDNNALPGFFGIILKHSDTYAVFNSSPETRLTYINELVNSCEFSNT